MATTMIQATSTKGFRLGRPLLLLAVATVLAGCSPKGEELYARAEKSLAAGEVNAAVIDLKNLVKDDPQNGKARALLADALAQQGDFGAAAIEVQKAKTALAAEAALLSIDLAEGNIKEKISKQDHERILKDYIKKVGGKG